jgi:undecaprenyl-diphosphatase
MVIVRDGGVNGVEAALFHAVNDLPGLFGAPMYGVQMVGVLAVAPVAAVVALVLRRYRLAVALAALAPLKLLIEKSVIKALVERQRPGSSVSDAVVRGDVPTEGLSFPSGHVIIAFGVAVLIAPYVGSRWRLVAFVVAVLAGVSRVYLGAHLPLDVLAGAAAGVALASALNLATAVPTRHAEDALPPP